MKDRKVSQIYDHYYRYEEILALEEKYVSEHPGYARRTKIGETPEGREIFVMEITDLSTGDFADKPAFYTEGNIHAGEVTGCMTTMYLMDTIFTNLDDELISRLLKRYTIYVLPRVSPDGSEYYLTQPESVRSVSRMYPSCDMMPGLHAQDMDGDGVVRCMRVKSPYGAWKVSEKDARVMARRKPDDVDGEFYNVYVEGMINDFDGVHIITAPDKFGNDFNRNYPAGWRTENEQHGAGEYPLSNPETQANARFLLNHDNVCAVIDMHTHGGMILYTPGCKPAKEVFKEDVELYKAIGALGGEESGYPVINVYDEFMPADAPQTYGGFDDFCHMALGIPAFTIECWDIAKRAGIKETFPPKNLTAAEEEDEVIAHYKWVDANLTGEQHTRAIMTWTKFDHPQLGEVEIGGLDVKNVVQNPPIPFLEQELQKHVRFMLRTVMTLPNVSFRAVKAEKLADGLYKLTANVMNTGFMSSYVFKEALKLKRAKPLKVTLEGAEEFVNGKAETEIGQLNGFADVVADNSCYGANTEGAENCEKQLEWVIRAKAGTKICLSCSGTHIGKVCDSVELK